MMKYMDVQNKKVIMVVLDGWGVTAPGIGNAIDQARTPTMDMIEKSYFATTLQASGIAVGLPWGREGNSEVGHMNLGAGRIVYQYLPRIMEAIREGSFFKNEALLGAVNFVKQNNSTLHLMGLLSSGTVHSYVDHLYALLDLAKQNDIKEVVLHVITDGKDSKPKEGETFIQNLKDRMEKQNLGKIGSIVGRVYAMDRNGRWDLIERTYNLLTKGEGNKTQDPVAYLKEQYAKGRTDFDMPPAVVKEGEEPADVIKEKDAVVFFNFREDSARQITKAFVAPDKEFEQFDRKKINNLYFVGMTEYEPGSPMEVAFPPPRIDMNLAETVSKAQKKQLHTAETEKYAHVTYFFNGEIEVPYPGEDRVMMPSMRQPHYENAPEMQAYNITQKVTENLAKGYDFILINYANADMIAHTGDIKATVEAVEAIDTNMSTLVEAAANNGYTVVITSDHGHAEQMRNLKTGQITTGHTTNPVPLFIIDRDFTTENFDPLYKKEPAGVLADVAPTILKIMRIQVPEQMTGKPLI